MYSITIQPPHREEYELCRVGSSPAMVARGAAQRHPQCVVRIRHAETGALIGAHFQHREGPLQPRKSKRQNGGGGRKGDAGKIRVMAGRYVEHMRELGRSFTNASVRAEPRYGVRGRPQIEMWEDAA